MPESTRAWLWSCRDAGEMVTHTLSTWVPARSEFDTLWGLASCYDQKRTAMLAKYENIKHLEQLVRLTFWSGRVVFPHGTTWNKMKGKNAQGYQPCNFTVLYLLFLLPSIRGSFEVSFQIIAALLVPEEYFPNAVSFLCIYNASLFQRFIYLYFFHEFILLTHFDQ